LVGDEIVLEQLKFLNAPSICFAHLTTNAGLSSAIRGPTNPERFEEFRQDVVPIDILARKSCMVILIREFHDFLCIVGCVLGVQTFMTRRGMMKPIAFKKAA
jgi:hypothetical protein